MTLHIYSIFTTQICLYLVLSTNQNNAITAPLESSGGNHQFSVARDSNDPKRLITFCQKGGPVSVNSILHEIQMILFGINFNTVILLLQLFTMILF